ncbi:SusD/RagB family nutrient-binding outer membrane lipoprotein [Flammeovirga aprica]|uniref:SusD/RagB family nutrient-binding outer membrane lipoprotein n=1 Tax=Flammeovirga aprica JL-4 TaxID=694437 RepID=A0A7X9XBE3_9BACT|nr:SusD/RagB family nutrient-binding outer membrane lipoprotein [Flammeovirga aprica]NME70632.1 SusD/RagB family nutrient-binding outer membrane lipoprotein [Flammeovirga aprica JL-4]
MKKFIHSVIVLLLMLTANSCTHQFEEINTNRHEYQKIEPELVFPGVVKRSLDYIKGDMSNQMYIQYSHNQSIGGGTFASYFFSHPVITTWWKYSYVDILHNIEDVIRQFEGEEGYTNRVGIFKIWKAYVMSVVVGTWGPVPYSESLSGALSMGYDSEEEIIVDLLTELNEVYDTLDSNGDTMYEPIFQGDILKWKKFSNTLMLKLALRYQNASAESRAFGKMAMQREEDLISLESEAVKASWGTAEENWSWFYRRYVFTNSIVSFKMGHYFMTFMRDLDDPRISKYAQKPERDFFVLDTLSRANGSKVIAQYVAPYLGSPKTMQFHDNWLMDDQENPYGGLGEESFSNVGEEYLAPDLEVTFIGYAETCFMKAEARLLNWGGSSSAKAYYEEGIAASFTQKGMADKVSDYLSHDGVSWGTSSEGVRDFRGIVTSKIDRGPIQQVITQRWIDGYFQPFDGWCLIRRTDYFDVPPHFNALNRGGLGTNVPERMVYPSSEMNLNGIGYQQGVSLLGGVDYLDIPLIFSKRRQWKDWGAMQPDLNNDLLKHWYGSTVEDLDAQGVEYTIIEEL